MSQQRNMLQMKEQDKTLEELNEVEMGNLLEKEFKLMITKMIKELGRKADKHYCLPNSILINHCLLPHCLLRYKNFNFLLKLPSKN